MKVIGVVELHHADPRHCFVRAGATVCRGGEAIAAEIVIATKDGRAAAAAVGEAPDGALLEASQQQAGSAGGGVEGAGGVDHLSRGGGGPPGGGGATCRSRLAAGAERSRSRP